MAPRAERQQRPADPRVVRHLLEASLIYQGTVAETVSLIQEATEEGQLTGAELEYAQLLAALSEAERALSWVAERSRVLLGEA